MSSPLESRAVSTRCAAPKLIVDVPSEKPAPVRVPPPPLNGLLMFMSTCDSVGTICSTSPLASRASRTVPVVGTLYAYEDVTLAPKVSGKVLRVFKDLGDRVGHGEPLMELDPTEYRLAVEQARPLFFRQSARHCGL